MAPPAEPPATITLRVKVPPGHIEGAADEFTLGTEVPVNASIGQVRERIQRTVPSSPPPERQRLLYGGRALVDNEQTLADALNIRRDPSQAEYVVHLLVKGDGTATAPGPHRRGVSTAGTPSPAPTAQHPPPFATDTPQPQPQQHAHAHVHPLHHEQAQQQHIQHHQAALAAQQQQLLHNLNHPPHVAGQAPGPMPFGLQQMHFGAGFPTMPLGQQFGHPQGHAMPLQVPVAQADGASEPHPTGSLDIPGLSDGPPRSASQPPPQPRAHGVFLEGRGPNGERFHIQQHVQLGPHAVLPPGAGLPHMPQFAQQQPIPRRPTALEQARFNIAEMRRMLSELRGLDVATDEQRNQIDHIQQRTQEVNNYIDPFNLGGLNVPGGPPPNGALTANTAQGPPIPRPASQPPRMQATPPFPPVLHQQAPSAATSHSQSEVFCYMLSSPTGPQAILYSPQHGTFTGGAGTPAAEAAERVQARAERASERARAQAAANAPAERNIEQAIAAQPVAAAAAGAQERGLGAIGPGLINHMWLLMRVLIFAYFILGANLGWRRPLALVAIAAGFWLLRQGPLGEGGVLRRWWDGVVNQDQRPQNGLQPAQGQVADVRPGQMPTPAQVAQRLLDEDRQQRNHRLSWLREQIRPAERAVALLIASLWPGVGEAYVRALEAEERRRNEEEIAARRREEEERQRHEEEEKQKAEGAAASVEDGTKMEELTAGASTDGTAAGDSGEKSDLIDITE